MQEEILEVVRETQQQQEAQARQLEEQRRENEQLRQLIAIHYEQGIQGSVVKIGFERTEINLVPQTRFPPHLSYPRNPSQILPTNLSHTPSVYSQQLEHTNIPRFLPSQNYPEYDDETIFMSQEHENLVF